MSAPKGTRPPNAGRGRVKGTPNRSTAEARAALAEFVDGNAHRLQTWLDAIAVNDPAKAFALFLSVIEYHIPKVRPVEAKTTEPLIVVLKEMAGERIPLEEWHEFRKTQRKWTKESAQNNANP